jgi:outer membrane lipoprotein
MIMLKRTKAFFVVLSVVLLEGCAESAHQSGQYIFDEVLPRELRSQVDRDVNFQDLRTAPEQYQDKVVMLSGIVLQAKRVKDRTEVEVLQLPAEPGEPPTANRTSSQGRFLMVKDDMDPATVEPGHPVTVIGQVKGKATKLLDETEYTYPVVEIKHLVDWEKMGPRYAGGYAPYGYYGGPYYRRGFFGGYYPYDPFYSFGPYGYGYGPFGYYPYFGPGFGSGGSAPSPPPAQSVPPEFRKRND